MRERISFQQAYDHLLGEHNDLVDRHNEVVLAVRELRKTVEAQSREIEYLKRASRGPGARRNA